MPIMLFVLEINIYLTGIVLFKWQRKTSKEEAYATKYDD